MEPETRKGSFYGLEVELEVQNSQLCKGIDREGKGPEVDLMSWRIDN